jgi:hypothetical protein
MRASGGVCSVAAVRIGRESPSHRSLRRLQVAHHLRAQYSRLPAPYRVRPPSVASFSRRGSARAPEPTPSPRATNPFRLPVEPRRGSDKALPRPGTNGHLQRGRHRFPVVAEPYSSVDPPVTSFQFIVCARVLRVAGRLPCLSIESWGLICRRASSRSWKTRRSSGERHFQASGGVCGGDARSSRDCRTLPWRHCTRRWAACS